MKIIAQNKKAYFEYEILETYEAGLQLRGEEIKTIRAGKVNLAGSYVKILNTAKNTEAYWIGGNISNVSDPGRSRKLLLHKTEITKLIGKTREKGLTLVPTKIYLKNGKAKLEIALGKGKKLHDKREAIKDRDWGREKSRLMRDKG